jgi:hypothetical protein
MVDFDLKKEIEEGDKNHERHACELNLSKIKIEKLKKIK